MLEPAEPAELVSLFDVMEPVMVDEAVEPDLNYGSNLNHRGADTVAIDMALPFAVVDNNCCCCC